MLTDMQNVGILRDRKRLRSMCRNLGVILHNTIFKQNLNVSEITYFREYIILFTIASNSEVHNTTDFIFLKAVNQEFLNRCCI